MGAFPTKLRWKQHNRFVISHSSMVLKLVKNHFKKVPVREKKKRKSQKYRLLQNKKNKIQFKSEENAQVIDLLLAVKFLYSTKLNL